MKKIFRILVLLAVVSLFAVTKSNAQISLKLQLNRPAQYENNERNHPNRPSPNHIWIAEEWVSNGNGGYNYKPGYWTLPPRTEWIAGHWKNENGGFIWIKGYWRVYANGNQIVVQE
jgi:hypothetical protein